MRNILLALVSAFLFASCGEMNETITINKDGSGTQEISSDMIPMMKQMMMGFAAMGQEEGEEIDSVELMKKVDEMVWKDFPEEMDSVITFTDRLPEEVKSDPDKMAVMENTIMYMRGGRKYGYVNMGIVYDFDNPEGLELFNKLSQESGKTDQRFNMVMSDSKTTIKATNNSFYRSSVRNQEESEDEDGFDSSKLMAMLGETTFTTTINTPGKIKNVKLKTYELVEQTDRSVTISYKIADYLTEDEVSVKVEWK